MPTPSGTIRDLAHGFPRPVQTMPLGEFEAHPDHALLQAAAGDFGTLIYTMGRPEHGNERLGFVGVAVIVPVEEYRRLTLKGSGCVPPQAESTILNELLSALGKNKIAPVTASITESCGNYSATTTVTGSPNPGAD